MNNQFQNIRGYELHERIGEGGFGEVYRAFQPSVARDVAIKIIRSDKANEPEFIRRFELEARLIASVEHPHIVPLFDYWRDPSGAYLVMRWLRSGSLKNRLKKGPLPLDSTIRVVNQIASALAIAHRHNVVHRDLKPENILLDDENNAYLTDFGIAAVIGQSQSDDDISGSIQYIAPEQLQGYPPAPTMDIYSLGLVIYELVTGKYVFGDAKPHQIITKHLTEAMPTIILDGIPDTINALIQEATAKDPGERFADVRDVAKQLQEILNPTSVSTEESTEIDDVELENPYKGLSPFGYEDIADFFGRDDLITKLIQRLEDRHAFHRFLVLIGPSGSGKSSVVRAGLIPRLWNDGLSGSSEWYYCHLTPSTNPIDQLETSLLSIAASPPSHLRDMLTSNKAGLLWAANQILDNKTSEMFIFIDQFEELFTLTDDDIVREQFLDLIYTAVTAPDSRIRVVATLRADFTDRPLEYIEFGELVRERSELMIPMKPAEIEHAITGPANRVGLTVDTDLIAAMVGDIIQEPGALPLLQYTLTVLYDLRQDRTLTLSAYHQLGGIQGTLVSQAEKTFNNLSEDAKILTEQVFLRLVTLSEENQVTRRRAFRTELSGSPNTLNHILHDFGAIRILTFDIDPITRVPTVEIAHEALINSWDRFKNWVQES